MTSLREFPLEYCNGGSIREKLESQATRWRKEFDSACIRFDTTPPEYDGQME